MVRVRVRVRKGNIHKKDEGRARGGMFLTTVAMFTCFKYLRQQNVSTTSIFV